MVEAEETLVISVKKNCLVSLVSVSYKLRCFITCIVRSKVTFHQQIKLWINKGGQGEWTSCDFILLNETQGMHK